MLFDNKKKLQTMQINRNRRQKMGMCISIAVRRRRLCEGWICLLFCWIGAQWFLSGWNKQSKLYTKNGLWAATLSAGSSCVPLHGKVSSVLICSEKINGIIEIRRRRNRKQSREHCYAVICNNHLGFVLCGAGGSGYSLLLQEVTELEV